jgi:Holliday junction resolvasome RuvABC endonuclease subunit
VTKFYSGHKLTSDSLGLKEPCILGLDVSTSITGWSLLSLKTSKYKIGYLPFKSSSDIYSKANTLREFIRNNLAPYNIRAVYVEEDLQRFKRGFSSAKTLATLTRFNGVVCQICFEEIGLRPEHINVNVARKSAGIKYDRKDKSKTTKEKVFEEVKKMVDHNWPTKVLKAGPRRGQEILHPGAYDAADAYVISVAGKNQFFVD